MENKIPEFDLFKRLEKLEGKTRGKFSSRDVYIVALASLITAWWALSMHNPHDARQNKDGILKALKNAGINKELLDILGEIFSEQCDIFDKYSA